MQESVRWPVVMSSRGWWGLDVSNQNCRRCHLPLPPRSCSCSGTALRLSCTLPFFFTVSSHVQHYLMSWLTWFVFMKLPWDWGAFSWTQADVVLPSFEGNDWTSETCSRPSIMIWGLIGWSWNWCSFRNGGKIFALAQIRTFSTAIQSSLKSSPPT